MAYIFQQLDAGASLPMSTITATNSGRIAAIYINDAIGGNVDNFTQTFGGTDHRVVNNLSVGSFLVVGGIIRNGSDQEITFVIDTNA